LGDDPVLKRAVAALQDADEGAMVDENPRPVGPPINLTDRDRR